MKSQSEPRDSHERSTCVNKIFAQYFTASLLRIADFFNFKWFLFDYIRGFKWRYVNILWTHFASFHNIIYFSSLPIMLAHFVPKENIILIYVSSAPLKIQEFIFVKF